MQTYREFEFTHWPAEGQPVAAKTIAAAAEALGLRPMTPANRYAMPSSLWAQVTTTDVRVVYHRLRHEGRSLVFSPTIAGVWGSEPYGEQMRAELLRRVNPPEIVVEMPEETVELPLPAWLVMAGDATAEAWPTSTRMFRSEAATAAAAFRAQLGAALVPPVGAGRRYLLNSFSAQMLMPSIEADGDGAAAVTFRRLDDAAARAWLAAGPWESRVGHESTAAIIVERLGVAVEVNRVGSLLRPGDTALIAQYVGPRLAEGATSLPTEARIEWLVCEV